MKKPMSKEVFEATMCFTKANVELYEYKIHKLIYNLKLINMPKIYSYDRKNKIMIMEKIHNMNISDFYGENPENVPPDIFNKIQEAVKKLYYFGISYPDITGYNFIYYNNKIYVIDFEHAKFFTNSSKIDPFIHKFISGSCEWNPEFK